MSGITITIIIIISLVFWALFFRQINPSNKTDKQLWKLYRIAQYGTKELSRIDAEMVKRGLLSSSPLEIDISQLDPNEQKKLELVKQALTESGLQSKMEKFLSTEIPIKMLYKTIDIANKKGTSLKNASEYLYEQFTNTSFEYLKNGYSPDEADERASHDVLSEEIKNS